MVLDRNYFQFRGEFYLQHHDTALGSARAPSIAFLYVSNFEAEHVLTNSNPFIENICLFKRHIDDVSMIWRGSEERLQEFELW